MESQDQNNYPIDGDYQVDGLWYCCKCHTPKECRVPIPGLGIRTERIRCKCEIEKDEAEEQLLRQYEQRKKLRQLRDDCFQDTKMMSWTFENDDGTNTELVNIAKGYVNHFEEMRAKGTGLLLYGNVGTGKTYIACCIANALIKQGYSCLFTNLPTLVNQISGTFEGKQEIIDSLNDYDLLILDDLASERNTQYMIEQVTNIIDSRYRIGKPLIITTNLTKSDLLNTEETGKERIYSRLMDMCLPYEVKGKDRRKENLKRNYAKTMSSLLE